MDNTFKAVSSSERVKKIILLARIQEALALPSLKRPGNTIPVFRVELDALKAADCDIPKTASGFEWAKSADDLLNLAITAFKAGDAEQGWRCLKAADRLMWHGLNRVAPDTLKSRAGVIAIESADDLLMNICSYIKERAR